MEIPPIEEKDCQWTGHLLIHGEEGVGCVMKQTVFLHDTAQQRSVQNGRNELSEGEGKSERPALLRFPA